MTNADAHDHIDAVVYVDRRSYPITEQDLAKALYCHVAACMQQKYAKRENSTYDSSDTNATELRRKYEDSHA